MITPAQIATDGVNSGVDKIDGFVGVVLQPATTLAVGTPILRDLTQLPGGLLPNDVNPSRLFFNARTSDRGVLATATNPGDVLGVFQGVGEQGVAYANTSGAVQTYPAILRKAGIGRVLAGAVTAGTAVTVGATLITTNANVFATVGTRAIGTSIGRVIAYAVNTTIAVSIATGSQVVTPASMIGINTTTALTIDTGAAQEVVTPTAVTATTFTATFANTHVGPGIVVQGITSAFGASIIPVPGASFTQAVVLVDIGGIL